MKVIKTIAIMNIPYTKRKAVYFNDGSDNAWCPVVYFRKPKGVSKEDFERVIEALKH